MATERVTLNESIGLFETSRSVKPWNHLTDEVVAPMVEAARRVANPDYELGWCFRHNGVMDNLAFCERRNAMSADLEDRCEQEQAVVIRSAALGITTEDD